tara:strand:- start:4793 stop:5758 length:966 start_codon:yes stop_codon:yes gene_type:complete
MVNFFSKNKSMVNLIIHPGFAKTGTTFFQEIILPNVKKTISIGKPYRNRINIKKFLYNKKKIPNKKDFSEFIERLNSILKKNEIKNIILSDESILDYEFYDPERNIKFLKIFISELKKKNKINLIFLLSTRRQEDLLISRYAYLYPRLKKRYPQFIDYIENSNINKKKFFDLLKYNQTAKKLKYLFKCKIVFLPLEYLEFSPKIYISIINRLFGSKIDSKIFPQKKINENKYKNKNTLKIGNLWFNMYYYLYSSKKIKKITNRFKKNLIYNFTRNVIYKNIKFDKSKNSYSLDESLRNKIQKIYHKDNKRLNFYKDIFLKK